MKRIGKNINFFNKLGRSNMHYSFFSSKTLNKSLLTWHFTGETNTWTHSQSSEKKQRFINDNLYNHFLTVKRICA
jgi:hypothetical protein